MSERVYFDCNATYGPHPKKHREARWTREHLVEDLDLAGIAGALVFHTQCLEYDPMLSNLRLIEDIAPHRERLYPCWIALPSMCGEFPDVPEFCRLMAEHDVRAVRIDAEAFGIPEKESLWGELRDALLAEDRLVIVSSSYGSRTLEHVGRILEIFSPNKTLLVGHPWSLWREVVHLMDTYPLLHTEFSSFQANRAIEFFSQRFGAHRCLFGTGLMTKAPGAARGFLDWTLLPDDQASLIAGANLKRLLGGAGPLEAPPPGEWHDDITEAARAGRPLPCLALDAHCHILHRGGHTLGGARIAHKGDADGMIELTRRAGIDRTAIMSWAGPLSMDTDFGNEVVADAVRSYPEEFVGLATINPEHQSEEEIEEVIRTYHIGLKFAGLKTFAPGQNLAYDDPAFDRWFGFADRHGLYAVIDPGGNLSRDQIVSLARKFPSMGIHLDHCGKSWDYAKWAVDIVLEFPNIWAQINFTLVTNGVVEYLVDRLGADRVLFGTDAPMRDPRPQVGWLAFTRLRESDKRKVFGENFRGILDRASASLAEQEE